MKINLFIILVISPRIEQLSIEVYETIHILDREDRPSRQSFVRATSFGRMADERDP